MPTSEITGYVVSHKWDDGSENEIKVSAGGFSDGDSWVWVKSDGDDSFFFRPESWPLIRDKVDDLFKQMAEAEQSGGPQ